MIISLLNINNVKVNFKVMVTKGLKTHISITFGWWDGCNKTLLFGNAPRPRNDVNKDKSVQLSDILLQKMSAIFNFFITSPFKIIVSVIIGNTRHLSVACFCVIQCIFIQVLANNLKLCQTNCPW